MLEVDGLVAGYGSIPVLRNVSFTLKGGEILLVGGENGAGKTTLARTLAGFNKAESGTIALSGQSLTNIAPETIARKGLRLVHDGHRVFPELSVYDNLRMGAAAHKISKADFTRSLDEIFAVFAILNEKKSLYARDLSGGQQQMLALAQAFVARPKLLICDEPSMGLAQALMPPILGFLRRWANSGTAVMIIEQHLTITAPYADRVLIMERGAVTLECKAEELNQRLNVSAPAQQ